MEIINHFIYRLEHPQIWWEWWHPETNALRYKGTTVINPCELWEVGIEVHFPWRMSSGSNIICWKDFTFTGNLPWCLCQTSIDCICLVLSGLFLFLCEMEESVFVLSLLLGPNSRSWLLLLRHTLFEASTQSSRYFILFYLKKVFFLFFSQGTLKGASTPLGPGAHSLSAIEDFRCLCPAVWPLLVLVDSSLCICSSVLSHGPTVSLCVDFRGLPFGGALSLISSSWIPASPVLWSSDLCLLSSERVLLSLGSLLTVAGKSLWAERWGEPSRGQNTRVSSYSSRLFKISLQLPLVQCLRISALHVLALFIAV